jgi:hypothetical protein
MAELRNPGLFQRLQYATSSGVLPPCRVGVSIPNQSARYGVARPGSSERVLESFGESYRVNCPACRDTRRRLYFSHAWGEIGPSGERDYRLLKCHNEDCQKQPDFIADMVRALDPLRCGAIGAQTPPNLSQVVDDGMPQIQKLPGVMTPLTDLPESHPALVYLRRQYIVPSVASSQYGAGWVGDARWWRVSNRIVVPIYMSNQLYGWQARYVDDAGSQTKGIYECENSSCRNRVRSEIKLSTCPACGSGMEPVLKWRSCAGMQKNKLLFNYDGARAWPGFTVIVEGPADVMSMGSPTNYAVRGPVQASFGNTLSAYQRDRLLLPWAMSGGVIFLAYDFDVWEKTLEQAVAMTQAGVCTVPVPLPADKDPADIGPDMAWDCVRRAAHEFGVYEKLKGWLK